MLQENNPGRTGLKKLLSFMIEYFRTVHRLVLFACILLMSALIYLNYTQGWEQQITEDGSWWQGALGMTLLFLITFILPWLFYGLSGKRLPWRDHRFVFLLVAAPVLFALKYVFDWPFEISSVQWRSFWQYVVHWPLLVLLIGIALFVIWKWMGHPDHFYGLSNRSIHWSPYLIALALMLPLVAAAATQPDFQETYPKLKLIGEGVDINNIATWKILLFELSYGSDFITIELFFRGFLVLAFTKWFGREAILPMACFYCAIHFGKPLGECISSFFGGMILGVVVFHTRSILGGLLVHLGIAWMMELAGYVGGKMFG